MVTWPFNTVCLKIVNTAKKSLFFASNILNMNKYKVHLKYFSEKLNNFEEKRFYV